MGNAAKRLEFRDVDNPNSSSELFYEHGNERDSIRDLALLEDSDLHRQELRERLESEGYNVLTPESKEDCLSLLEFGCRTFLLDIHIEHRSKVEGLKTLEAIKRACPEAFCVIVTGDRRFRPQAISLQADLVCEKSERDYDRLINELNQVYFRRRYNLPNEVTVLNVGAEVRREAPPGPIGAIANAAKTVATRSEYINSHIADGDLQGAAKELILLEPAMRALSSAAQSIGDGFGIVIDALWNGIIQHQELTGEQWTVWTEVFETAIAKRNLTTEESCVLASELDEAGFNTDPPYWPEFTAFLELDDKSLP